MVVVLFVAVAFVDDFAPSDVMPANVINRDMNISTMIIRDIGFFVIVYSTKMAAQTKN